MPKPTRKPINKEKAPIGDKATLDAKAMQAKLATFVRNIERYGADEKRYPKEPEREPTRTEMTPYIQYNEETGELACDSPELAQLIRLVTNSDPALIFQVIADRAQVRKRIIEDSGYWLRLLLMSKSLKIALDEDEKTSDRLSASKNILSIVGTVPKKKPQKRRKDAGHAREDKIGTLRDAGAPPAKEERYARRSEGELLSVEEASRTAKGEEG